MQVHQEQEVIEHIARDKHIIVKVQAGSLVQFALELEKSPGVCGVTRTKLLLQWGKLNGLSVLLASV